MDNALLARLREAIRGESLDGWLFYNFRHRDRLSDEILGIEQDRSNTRPWIYAVPASGDALKIVNSIERAALDGLPGAAVEYGERSALFAALAKFSGQRWAAHISEELPVISFLDEGTAGLVRREGLELVPAAALVQRFKGLLDEGGAASHERAAGALRSIVEECWNFVDHSYRTGTAVTEGEVRNLMLAGMEKRGLVTDHPPIVGAGAHTADPHYDFSGAGAPFARGDVIQFDLWAKERAPAAIYADISWVGVFGESADEGTESAWRALRSARDAAVGFIGAELAAGRRPTGASVDRRVRERLIADGYGEALRHRTGHGIDTECHGSGANLDSVEFPDHRLLLDGSCFSVEPGLYFDFFGLRTEIDVYISGGKPVVSGGKAPQIELLYCGRSSH